MEPQKIEKLLESVKEIADRAKKTNYVRSSGDIPDLRLGQIIQVQKQDGTIEAYRITKIEQYYDELGRECRNCSGESVA